VLDVFLEISDLIVLRMYAYDTRTPNQDLALSLHVFQRLEATPYQSSDNFFFREW